MSTTPASLGIRSDAPSPRVVLSYGLGLDSTALLLRWIHEPSSRNFDLRELAVCSSMVGDEFQAVGRDVQEHIVPLLVTHEDRASVARRRLSQFLLVPKGYGLLVVSGFIGAMLGLAVTDTPQAHGLLRSVMLALAYGFAAIMGLVSYHMTHIIKDDLHAMGQGPRIAVAKDFLRKWAELLPPTTLLGRILPPRRRLVLGFAQNPSITYELMIPTFVMAVFVGYFVLSAMSPVS